MSDMAYFILVLIGATIIIFGAAYLMDKGRKKVNTKTPLQLGSVSRLLLWMSRGILVITVLALVGSFLVNEIFYAKLAGSFLLAYIISGFVFQISRRKGI
jgi:hypothetical protein